MNLQQLFMQNILMSVDAHSAQERVLLQRIIPPNADCEFGRRHGFSAIRSISDFQQAVPLHSYDDFRSDIERMTHGEAEVLVSEPVRRFFITSGSTASPKVIPVTSSFIRDKWRAFQWFWGMVRHDHPGVCQGTLIGNFSDGSREQTSPGGALCSSESSFWNAWSGADCSSHHPLPRAILNIVDAEARYYTIARILLETNVALLMSLNPSTIARLIDVIDRHAARLHEDIAHGGLSLAVEVEPEVRKYVAERYPANADRATQLARLFADRERPGLAARLWPALTLTVCWRSSMVRPYLELLDSHLAGVPQRDYITMASEGVIAIPFKDCVSGGALAIDTHFYEFIPENLADQSGPPVLLAHELERDKNYIVVLTTSAGLYRYNIGDVVRVIDFIGTTPVLEFLHRAGNTCSLTGEKLTEDQVATSVSTVASRFDFDLHAFTMCPISKPFPHYALIAELQPRPDRHLLCSFLAQLDHALARQNVEYHSKRTSGRLGAPELWLLASGSYAALRQRRIAGGVSDAQVKIACLTRDLKWYQQFEVVEQIACELAA